MKFSRQPKPGPNGKQDRQAKQIDDLILQMGQATEEAILNSLAESRASWQRTRRWLAEQRAADAAWRAAGARKEAERLEKEYPGYRGELNRQRAIAGLPRL